MIFNLVRILKSTDWVDEVETFIAVLLAKANTKIIASSFESKFSKFEALFGFIGGVFYI